MADIKYQYAYNEEGKVVSINDFTKEESKLHTYKCIGCGNPLSPRAIGSNRRRAHFYHKEVNCSEETYLHKLGKHLIKEKFDSSDSFFISYNTEIKCGEKLCSFRNYECTRGYKQVKYNLKEYYDTCTKETPIRDYIADLLLTNSKNPKTPPLLIEICVTHKCEDAKIKSGLKIIEISVRNEQDLSFLFTSDTIVEKCDEINFFSFLKEKSEPMERYIYRYVLKSINENGYVNAISCKNAKYKFFKDSIVELNMDNSSENVFIPLFWLAKHKNFRRCNLCKFYGSTRYEKTQICRLSKKYGKPKFPNMNEAERCKSFQLEDLSHVYHIGNIEEVKLLQDYEKEEYRIIISGSSSFYNYDLLEEKCDLFLTSKIRTHRITILFVRTKPITELISKYCNKKRLNYETFHIRWKEYGNRAPYLLNDEMLTHANAVIAFWDGNSKITQDLITQANNRRIPVRLIQFQDSDI